MIAIIMPKWLFIVLVIYLGITMTYMLLGDFIAKLIIKGEKKNEKI